MKTSNLKERIFKNKRVSSVLFVLIALATLALYRWVDVYFGLSLVLCFTLNLIFRFMSASSFLHVLSRMVNYFTFFILILDYLNFVYFVVGPERTETQHRGTMLFRNKEITSNLMISSDKMPRASWVVKLGKDNFCEFEPFLGLFFKCTKLDEEKGEVYIYKGFEFMTL